MLVRFSQRPLLPWVVASMAGYWLWAMTRQPELDARTAARLHVR